MTQHTARSVHSHSGEHPFSWTAFKTTSLTPLHYFISLSISYWILLFAGRESIDFDAPVWTARFTSLSLWLAVWWFYISSTPPPHSDLGRGLISEHEWKQLCRAALKKPLLNSSEGYKEAQPRIQYTQKMHVVPQLYKWGQSRGFLYLQRHMYLCCTLQAFHWLSLEANGRGYERICFNGF